MTDSKKTILVVDDDPKIRLLIRRCLEGEGHDVVEAALQGEVEAALRDHEIALITLDLQLGPEDGLDIARAIRARSSVPIIMVTGKGEIADKVVGLEIGADDYISKPFHISEMLARVNSVLRRSSMTIAGSGELDSDGSAPDEVLFTFQNWVADPVRFTLTDPAGRPCELTSTDFKLLHLFLREPKRVLSRDRIMGELSGAEWTPLDRTVDNQVARLRKKIEVDPGKPEIIKTVRGVGYTFATDVETIAG